MPTPAVAPKQPEPAVPSFDLLSLDEPAPAPAPASAAQPAWDAFESSPPAPVAPAVPAAAPVGAPAAAADSWDPFGSSTAASAPAPAAAPAEVFDPFKVQQPAASAAAVNGSLHRHSSSGSMAGPTAPSAPLPSAAAAPADPFATTASTQLMQQSALRAAAPQAAAPQPAAVPALAGSATGMSAASSGSSVLSGPSPSQRATLSHDDIMALFSKPAEPQFGQPALQPQFSQPALQPQFGQPLQAPLQHARSASNGTGTLPGGVLGSHNVLGMHASIQAAAGAPQLHPQAGVRQGQGVFTPQPHPQPAPYSSMQQQHAQHLQAAGAAGQDLFASLAPEAQHASMRAGSGSMGPGGMAMGSGMGMAAQQSATRTVPVLQQPAPPVVPVAPAQQGFADFSAFSV